MSDDEHQIDEQLAADIDSQAVARLRELVATQIQRECDIQETSMSAAWQSIQNSIVALNRKKQIIHATLRSKESAERAQKVFDDEIRGMMPPTYHRIEKALQDRAKRDHLPSPVVSPLPARRDDFDRRSFTLEAAPSIRPQANFFPPAASTRVDGLPEVAAEAELPPTTPSKRKQAPQATTPASSKKKQRQSTICIQNATTNCPEHTVAEIQPTVKLDERNHLPTYEVDGRDFLFQDPKVGKDWLCVRCNADDPLLAVRFPQHPLESGCAMDHFNKKGAKCHDSSRSYTSEDILREFTYRVEEDECLNEEWVRKCNEVARDKAQAAAAKPPVGKAKGKGKAKQPAFAPANRRPAEPSHVPEADMSVSDVDTVVEEVIRDALDSFDIN